MDCIEVLGGNPLRGEVKIQSSKNATLPIIAASILAKGVTVLHNCPMITDVLYMAGLLEEIGCKITWEGHTLSIDTTSVICNRIGEENAKKMRSSVILLGSMIARCHEVRLPYPGGCVIGKRPIDMHWSALEKLGVKFEEKEDCFVGKAKELNGAEIRFAFPSVGATENSILAAVTAKGTTRLKGAAREPEISELCNFLKHMGAKIKWDQPDELVIVGVKKLTPTEFELPPDRIVAGTYLLAAAGTRGKVTLHNMPANQLMALEKVLSQMGAVFEKKEDTIVFDGSKAVHGVARIRTEPYPYFPTDLQSQAAAVLTVADSISILEETVFEARFKSAEQLLKMGADIRFKKNIATIHPMKSLYGCEVEAQELRGGAALVIAGLMAEGKTTVKQCRYLTRGYEDICKDLRELGAKIKTVV